METVILFPAVDLKNGQCVRLEQGDMARATVFNLDPAAQARAFAAQGFEYLHVVDLDGAFAGKPMNALAVEAMLKAVTMPVQLGGGIRDLKTIEAWLDKGIARVIIGTAVPTAAIIALGLWWTGSGRHSQIPFHASAVVPAWARSWTTTSSPSTNATAATRVRLE